MSKSQVICPILVAMFGTPSNAAEYLEKCLRGGVQRTNRGGIEGGDPSCSSYGVVLYSLLKGQTTLLECSFRGEVCQFIRIAMRVEGVKLAKPLRDMVFGTSAPATEEYSAWLEKTYCPLLWLEASCEAKYSDEACYEEIEEARRWWKAHLFNGKIMEGHEDGDVVEPPIRGKVLSRAKKSCYKAGKKLELAA